MSALANSPGSWADEIRVDATHNAINSYLRFRFLRRLAIVVTLAIAIVRLTIPVLLGPISDLMIVRLMGISVFLSFFSFAAEWSARTHCRDCLRQYKAQLREIGTMD